MRDHDKADLALAGLTLTVAAVAVGSEAVRWVRGRLRRHHHTSHSTSAGSTTPHRPWVRHGSEAGRFRAP